MLTRWKNAWPASSKKRAREKLRRKRQEQVPITPSREIIRETQVNVKVSCRYQAESENQLTEFRQRFFERIIPVDAIASVKTIRENG